MHESMILALQVAKHRDSMPDRAAAAKGAPNATIWPVNEIVLRSLVLSGIGDDAIAERYGTNHDSVFELRRRYRF